MVDVTQLKCSSGGVWAQESDLLFMWTDLATPTKVGGGRRRSRHVWQPARSPTWLWEVPPMHGHAGHCYGHQLGLPKHRMAPA